jgi:hypothetical protein
MILAGGRQSCAAGHASANARLAVDLALGQRAEHARVNRLGPLLLHGAVGRLGARGLLDRRLDLGERELEIARP